MTFYVVHHKTENKYIINTTRWESPNDIYVGENYIDPEALFRSKEVAEVVAVEFDGIVKAYDLIERKD